MRQSTQKSGGKDLTFFLILAIIIIVDRIVKLLIDRMSTKIEVIPNLFYISKSTNTGAAFSMLSGQNSLLMWAGIIIVGIILYLYPKIPEKKLPLTAFALITGGAIGNIIDRLMYGHVIDFISLTFWPSFNIADSAITVGAIMLVIWLLAKD